MIKKKEILDCFIGGQSIPIVLCFGVVHPKFDDWFLEEYALWSLQTDVLTKYVFRLT